MIPRLLKPVIHPFRKWYLPLFVKKPVLDNEFRSLPLSKMISKEDVVVEVGANVGGLTLELSGLAGHVYAFEPNPRTFEILKRYTKKKNNVTVFNYGLWNQNTSKRLITFPNSGDDTVATLVGNERRGVSVNLRSLDSFGLRPSILSLDCEGSEIEALRGAPETLRRVRFLMIETHLFPKLGLPGTFSRVERLLEEFEPLIVEKARAGSGYIEAEAFAVFERREIVQAVVKRRG